MKTFICIIWLLCFPVICFGLSVMQYQGSYLTGSFYARQDVVKYKSSVYVCVYDSCYLVPGSVDSGWDVLFQAAITKK